MLEQPLKVRLVIKGIAFLTFYIISMVMIISVFIIAALNVPDEVLCDYPSVRSVIVAVTLMGGPQLILAQSIAWWYNQFQRWLQMV